MRHDHAGITQIEEGGYHVSMHRELIALAGFGCQSTLARDHTHLSACMHGKGGWSAMMLACVGGDADTVVALLDAGAMVNLQNKVCPGPCDS